MYTSLQNISQIYEYVFVSWLIIFHWLNIGKWTKKFKSYILIKYYDQYLCIIKNNYSKFICAIYLVRDEKILLRYVDNKTTMPRKDLCVWIYAWFTIYVLSWSLSFMTIKKWALSSMKVYFLIPWTRIFYEFQLRNSTIEIIFINNIIYIKHIWWQVEFLRKIIITKILLCRKTLFCLCINYMWHPKVLFEY